MKIAVPRLSGALTVVVFALVLPTAVGNPSNQDHGDGMYNLTGICQLEDLGMGSCTLQNFCDTLGPDQYVCTGNYFGQWKVTKERAEKCHPPGLVFSFSSYDYNASSWDDQTAVETGHSCSTSQDEFIFEKDVMVSTSRTVFYNRPEVQKGRIDWTSSVHVCAPREHRHFDEFSRDVAYCLDSCLSYAVNQQECKPDCLDCSEGNTPYDCSNVDADLIPSCYPFNDVRKRFLKYFEKVNTGVEVVRDDGLFDASNSVKPGVEPCFTEARPLTCDKSTNRNLFGGAASPEETELITACNDIEVFFLSQIQHSTALHREAFKSVGKDSPWCEIVRKNYADCYWCAQEMLDGDEQYCSTLETFCEQDPEEVDETVDITRTCEDVTHWLDYFDIFPNTIDLCYRAKHSLHQGECDAVCDRDKESLRPPFRSSKRSGGLQGHFDSYLGANTAAKKKTLVWLTRASAFLSFCGGCYILYDVVNKASRAQVYHQLLGAMAVFDICTAAAWSLATQPLPEQAGHIFGANGSDTSCTVQGFFVQLGFTSVFYNVSLSTYYVLMIARGWREHDLKRIQIWLHAIPQFIGIALAVGGLPIYDWIEYGCMMPIHERWSALVFGVIPLGISIVCVTVSMIWIYGSVRKTSQRSNKWTFSSSMGASNPASSSVSSPTAASTECPTNTLESQVFWQAVLYALSFFITWPILFTIYLWSVDVKFDSFAFSCVVAFVAPLQGTTDFLVYIRPKVIKKRTKNAGASDVSSSQGTGATSGISQFNTCNSGRGDSTDMGPTPKNVTTMPTDSP